MPCGLLGRPQPVPMPGQFLHRDAIDWQKRVSSNGGSVSAATLDAVSEFCFRIEGQGLRGKFYRLSLVCGENLSAALVPLYTGPSDSSPPLGPSTDMAVNFVSADYQPTGTAGGLKGDGATKYLITGMPASNLQSAPIMHMAASWRDGETGTAPDLASRKAAMGHYQNAASNAYILWVSEIGVGRSGYAGNFDGVGGANGATTAESLFCFSRQTNTFAALFQAGSRVGTSTAPAAASSASRSFQVFALNASQHTAFRLRYYSIGEPLNASDVSALTSAVTRFRTLLGRT